MRAVLLDGSTRQDDTGVPGIKRLGDFAPGQALEPELSQWCRITHGTASIGYTIQASGPVSTLIYPPPAMDASTLASPESTFSGRPPSPTSLSSVVITMMRSRPACARTSAEICWLPR